MISLIIKHKKKETERKRQRENKKGRDGEEKKERNQIENTKTQFQKHGRESQDANIHLVGIQEPEEKEKGGQKE